MKTLNCYIGGRKCAVAMEAPSAVVLFSHSAAWSGDRFTNMLGWKFARRFPVSGLPGSLEEAAAFVAASLSLPYCCEGSDEYATIRANIRKVTKHSRRGSSSGSGSSESGSAAGEGSSVPPVVVPVVPASSGSSSGSIKHEKFGTLLEVLAGGEAAFLYGPAGSGKNRIVMDAAAELGLPFHYANSVQSVYELAGFIDAGGKYQETEFYRAFARGGVFMLFITLVFIRPRTMRILGYSLLALLLCAAPCLGLFVLGESGAAANQQLASPPALRDRDGSRLSA